jgi:hypothetical protein
MDTRQTAARRGMRQPQIDKPHRVLARRRRRSACGLLPLDPRDPDIVRAKDLQRGQPGE